MRLLQRLKRALLGPRLYHLYPLWYALANPQAYPELSGCICRHYPWATLDLPGDDGISAVAWIERKWTAPWVVIYQRRSKTLLSDWAKNLPDYKAFASVWPLIGNPDKPPILELLEWSLPHEEESGFGPEHFTLALSFGSGYRIHPFVPILEAQIPEPVRKLLDDLWEASPDIIRNPYPPIGSVWIEPEGGWFCYIDANGTSRRLERSLWEGSLATIDGRLLAGSRWLEGTCVCWIDASGRRHQYEGRPFVTGEPP